MSDRSKTGGEYVYEALVDAGLDLLVGLPGTQTLPLDRVVADRDEMRYVMARHETAVPHVAWAYYEVSGTPAATLTVPGPGETNAMHGLKNALEDSVPLVHVTGDAHPDERGKGPIHEIDPDTYDDVVKENVVVESRRDLPAAVERGIERALTPPYGPVRLGIPSRFLGEAFAAPTATVEPERVTRENGPAFDAAADLLADAERPLLYVGGGVRRSADGTRAVAALADELEATVLASYKGKGVFPEDDPRFLGVGGSHLPASARRAVAAADAVVALGADLDGLATDHWTLPLDDGLVHVTLDPDALGAAYEPAVGIVDDAATAARALGDRLAGRPAPDRWDPAAVGAAAREAYRDHLDGEGLFGAGESGIHTPAVLETVRETVPDDAVVTTDVGGFRLWTLQAVPVYEPDAFVTAGSWAGMGIGLPAAVGAKLARPERPVVCLSGDGGLLMCTQELATAAEEDLAIVLVVSNDADYGIISKSPEIHREGSDHAFAWESPDYATVAEGFGWTGASVADADALAGALRAALGRDGPTLIDVSVPADEPSAPDAADFETDLSF
ncbi:thiamine pyrophosphate-binding protein [Halomicrobium salinisoli]|uniref:thiamine pyrophosphate-binding protein n=1 Tax=Halomicrobium salinisoli TaxID=2878391 RepID=UPI001CF09214|nr:thiamine pyrophosphate-binding protein [Halomicrobium salinisoli]